MLRLIISYFLGRQLFESRDSREMQNNPDQKIVVGDRAYDLDFLRHRMSLWLNKEERSILYNQAKRSFYINGTTLLYRIDDIIDQILIVDTNEE